MTGGYEVSVAASNSEATSLNPNTMAYTNINFGIGTFEGGRQTNEPYMPSTSTATAALGNATQGGVATGASSSGSTGLTEDQKKMLLIAGGVLVAAVAIGAILYVNRK